MPVSQSFESSLAAYRNWLPEIRCHDRIRWVFREDVAFHRGQFWIKTPLPAINDEAARVQYDIGLRRELGIKLRCLCRMEANSGLGACMACYVWAPEDELSSSQSMSGPESLQFCGPPMGHAPRIWTGRTTGSALLWRYLRWRGDRWGMLAELPRRGELELGGRHSSQ